MTKMNAIAENAERMASRVVGTPVPPDAKEQSAKDRAKMEEMLEARERLNKELQDTKDIEIAYKKMLRSELEKLDKEYGEIKERQRIAAIVESKSKDFKMIDPEADLRFLRETRSYRGIMSVPRFMVFHEASGKTEIRTHMSYREWDINTVTDDDERYGRKKNVPMPDMFARKLVIPTMRFQAMFILSISLVVAVTFACLFTFGTWFSVMIAAPIAALLGVGASFIWANFYEDITVRYEFPFALDKRSREIVSNKRRPYSVYFICECRPSGHTVHRPDPDPIVLAVWPDGTAAYLHHFNATPSEQIIADKMRGRLGSTA